MNRNALWGDYFFVDPDNSAATQSGEGHDNREPLGTSWGARYLSGGAFDPTSL